MNFYQPHSKFYCGVDMHSRIIYICIIGEDKKILVHKSIRNQDTKQLLEILEPYRDNIVVSCESLEWDAKGHDTFSGTDSLCCTRTAPDKLK